MLILSFSHLQLLGKECYDIDIAIDNMLGSEFVDKVREYLLSTGEEVQGLGIIPRYGIHFFHNELILFDSRFYLGIWEDIDGLFTWKFVYFLSYFVPFTF